MKKRCAFLTLANPEGFVIQDPLAFEPLQDLGWRVEQIPWTDPGTDWRQFHAVVIRSTWDYQSDPDRFLATLQSIETSGTRLFNPYAVCRWNLDKSYLRELQSSGIPVVPTTWADRLTSEHLLQTDGPVVIKPTIGANADHIHVLGGDFASDPQSALEWYGSRPAMIQPFIETIRTRGEVSMFWFGGQYSHAVLKRPAIGDFRVQEEHGGLITAFRPDSDLRELGQRTIRALGQMLLYARVDMVWPDDHLPAVMEVELIEPSLYFSFDRQSPIRFAQALDTMVRDGRSGR